MKKSHVRHWVFVFSAVLMFNACSTTRDKRDSFSEKGVTACDVRFDETISGLIVDLPQALPYFSLYHRKPLDVPFYASILRSDLIDRSSTLYKLGESLASKAGVGSRRSTQSEQNAKSKKLISEPNSLIQVIEKMHSDFGKPLNSSAKKELKRKVESVPSALQGHLAYLFETARLSALLNKKELAKFGNEKELRAKLSPVLWDIENTKNDDPQLPDGFMELFRSYNRQSVFSRNFDFVRALQDFLDFLQTIPSLQNVKFDWTTPIGHISIHGQDKNSYPEDRDYLFLMDVAGDDLYRRGASSWGTSNPVSVLIDLQGNDRYVADPELDNLAVEKWKRRSEKLNTSSQFGVGVFGVGILIDRAGDDLYRSTSDSLGRGIFGIGILSDESGSDRYDCYAQCEGSADFGLAALLDRRGADHYEAFTASQGYSGPSGMGVLIDLGLENDRYRANDDVRDLAFKTGTAHNVSISQGAGAGWRRDTADGFSFAGGIGVLLDQGGANRFEAGIFAQGVGYWQGLGVLSAGEGDDIFIADYYGQGTSAHFAAGVLHDTGGNDHYFTREYQAMGHGRDFSLGVFIDDRGSDFYEAPSLSLGFGDFYGIGLFIDRKGNDRYQSSSAEVAGSVRIDLMQPTTLSKHRTTGVFIDSQGDDSYSFARKDVANNKAWNMELPKGSTEIWGARGLGVDTEEKFSLDFNGCRDAI